MSCSAHRSCPSLACGISVGDEKRGEKGEEEREEREERRERRGKRERRERRGKRERRRGDKRWGGTEGEEREVEMNGVSNFPSYTS